jgi:hypothetical protein
MQYCDILYMVAVAFGHAACSVAKVINSVVVLGLPWPKPQVRMTLMPLLARTLTMPETLGNKENACQWPLQVCFLC